MAIFPQTLYGGDQPLNNDEDATRFTSGVGTALDFTEFSMSGISEDLLYDSILTDGKTLDLTTFTMDLTPEEDFSNQSYFPEVPNSAMIRDIPIPDLAPDLTDEDQWCTALDEGINSSPMPPTEADPFECLLAPYFPDTTYPWLDPCSGVSRFNILNLDSAISDQVTSIPNQCPTPLSTHTPPISRHPAAAPNNTFDTNTQRWHATQSRSRSADRSFVYGVSTTKIFCRPSCASRRPSRKHVRFFTFPGAVEKAEEAGFRPCKRCIPDALGVKNTAVLGVCEVLRLIIVEIFGKTNTSGIESMKLEALAKSAGLSTFHFHRLFKATTQITTGDFVHACRSLALQDALGKDQAQGLRTVTNAMALVEESPCWSARSARKALGGITPAEYANGALNMETGYCCVNTQSGTVCVIYSPGKGDDDIKVHAVLLGEDAEARAFIRFPAAAASSHHADHVAKIIEGLEERCRDRDTEITAEILPVLWRARVWLRLVQHCGD